MPTNVYEVQICGEDKPRSIMGDDVEVLDGVLEITVIDDGAFRTVFIAAKNQWSCVDILLGKVTP